MGNESLFKLSILNIKVSLKRLFNDAVLKIQVKQLHAYPQQIQKGLHNWRADTSGASPIYTTQPKKPVKNPPEVHNKQRNQLEITSTGTIR